MINKDGGAQFLDFVGDTAVMTVDIAHGPPSPPH